MTKIWKVGHNAALNRDFDYNEPATGGNNQYEPDKAGDPADGDTAIDGFVQVKKGGYFGPANVPPLLLSEAPIL